MKNYIKKSFIILIGVLFFSIIAQADDEQYLGQYSNNPYSSDSTSNPYGQYGSQYGSESANNPYATNAPVIVSDDDQ